MRHLLSLAALAVIFANGCRSCTSMPTPIVGDSMSRWGATENSSQLCQPQTVDFRGALARLTCGLQSGGRACWGSNKYDDFGSSGGGLVVGCGDGGNCLNCPTCPAPSPWRGPRPIGGTTGMAPAGLNMGCAPVPASMPNMSQMNGMPCGASGQPAAGCGGRGCAGLCGGRCPAAHAAAGGGGQAGLLRHQLPHPLGNAHRACAYGKCGARPGPEYGSVSFPYYTVRGPRDFLAADPPSIGP